MHSHPDHQHTHAHANRGGSATRPLVAGMALTLAFALVELIGGWWFGSLALMSDSGHMFSDSAALFIAAVASRVAQKPAGSRHSYGLARTEVIAAVFNALLLVGIVTVIVIEAVQRLRAPQPVSGIGVLVIAFAGLVVNVVVLRILGHGKTDLNTRAASLHVLGDLAGSVAALTAGAVILVSGWYPIDPILSFVIAALILVSTLRILRDALHVLMEGVPPEIDLEEVGRELVAIEGVRSVHDLHVWTIASGRVALSAHIDVDSLEGWPVMLERIRSVGRQRFGIEHVTVQPEMVRGINADRQMIIPIIPRDSDAAR